MGKIGRNIRVTENVTHDNIKWLNMDNLRVPEMSFGVYTTKKSDFSSRLVVM